MRHTPLIEWQALGLKKPACLSRLSRGPGPMHLFARSWHAPHALLSGSLTLTEMGFQHPWSNTYSHFR